MNKPTKHVFITVLGYLFLFLGVIGAILPILQGWLFFLIGLTLLAKTTPWARRCLQKLRMRFPAIAAKADKWMARWK